MKKLSREGFGAAEAIIIVGVAIILGVAGYLVYNAHNKDTDKAAGKSSSDSTLPSTHDIDQKTDDTVDQTNIRALQVQLEVYFSNTGYYPTQANFYSADWRSQNMKDMDQTAATASNGKALGQTGGYTYVPAPADCDNVATQCTTYSLSAKLSDGSSFTKESLNQ